MMYRFLLLVTFLGCQPEEAATVRHARPSQAPSGGADSGPAGGEDSGTAPDDTPDDPPPSECGFTYEADFRVSEARARARTYTGDASLSTDTGSDGLVDTIAYLEPLPATLRSVAWGTSSVTMPDYTDTMPLFERAEAWNGKDRCFETPLGAMDLSESEAYALYRDIAEQTTGVAIDTTPGARTIVGIRGAWPGTFAWHGNAPDRFNDTLVVLWTEGSTRYVREFPVNTDTGDYYFGYHSASSLRPNRRYSYTNGWHRSYNAMSIAEYGYRVQDDSNGNGHWDSDRNGWLDGGSEDHERSGYGHNIHAASVNAPLGTASIYNWSAGCQTIPGMKNWTRFMEETWLEEGTDVEYFLVDARDIDPQVWTDCDPDGSHECPFRIDNFPFTDQRSSTSGSRTFDTYNCDDADESGPELVYVFTVDEELDLSVTVDSDPSVDVDIHLLEGDDPDACIDRAHISLDQDIGPGRYLLVIDTWFDGDEEMAGDFTLQVSAN